jgi:hypothetical protein
MTFPVVIWADYLSFLVFQVRIKAMARPIEKFIIMQYIKVFRSAQRHKIPVVRNLNRPGERILVIRVLIDIQHLTIDPTPTPFPIFVQFHPIPKIRVQFHTIPILRPTRVHPKPIPRTKKPFFSLPRDTILMTPQLSLSHPFLPNLKFPKTLNHHI